MQPLARRSRGPFATTRPGGVEDLNGYPASRGACATCGHDSDLHGLDGCEHDWPPGAVSAVLMGRPRPVIGCQCRGFEAITTA